MRKPLPSPLCPVQNATWGPGPNYVPNKRYRGGGRWAELLAVLRTSVLSFVIGDRGIVCSMFTHIAKFSSTESHLKQASNNILCNNDPDLDELQGSSMVKGIV